MTLNDPIFQAEEQVRMIIEQAVAKAVASEELPQGERPSYGVEIPADTTHGDFAVNIAMAGARVWRMAPPKIAEAIVKHMHFDGTLFTKATIAGPGFINFTIAGKWFSGVVSLINETGKDYGKTNFGQGEKVMVEFVSANPTGPMHLGNARGGVTGDCLAAVLESAGYDAHREFYLNDAGNQIKRFGESLDARYLEIFGKRDPADFPEDGYQGLDIIENAQVFADVFGDSLTEQSPEQRQKALVDYVLPRNIEAMKNTLEKYRVHYDTWFSESTLHEDGSVDKMIAMMTQRGLTYEADGALWYKATDFGGEQDEVLVRQNGAPTYFAVDIAYHYNKFVVRGFKRVVNFWGADHHGHVARLKGAMNAIGLDGDALEIVLFQLVRFVKDGAPAKMSKRDGKAISLGDFLDMVPVDAVRFYFNMRETGSAMDFDLDLAVEESSKNPVHYVRYAHARICSIIKRVESEGTVLREATPDELALLTAPEEVELIRSMAGYPRLIINAAKRSETASITHYATEVATLFHKFYTACYVNVEEDSLKQARLALCTAASTTLANVLALLKITAPETM